MDLSGYTKLLQGYKYLGFNIGDQANNTLREFSYAKRLSAYDIYSKFKEFRLDPRTLDSHNSKISYKNTRKRVKRLESLDFIERERVEDPTHGAKYYRISEAGIFQLFLRSKLSLTYIVPLILGLHGNYSIFEVLLYPYFKKETLPALKGFSDNYRNLTSLGDQDVSHDIIRAIELYLRECCSWIYEFIQFIPSVPRKYKSPKFDYYGAAIEPLGTQLTLLKDELVMKILMYFQRFKDTKGKSAVAILAQDDKFMNIADDIQRDFKKGFDIAMRLRTRT